MAGGGILWWIIVGLIAGWHSWWMAIRKNGHGRNIHDRLDHCGVHWRRDSRRPYAARQTRVTTNYILRLNCFQLTCRGK
jgi:hypothetical protein